MPILSEPHDSFRRILSKHHVHHVAASQPFLYIRIYKFLLQCWSSQLGARFHWPESSNICSNHQKWTSDPFVVWYFHNSSSNFASLQFNDSTVASRPRSVSGSVFIASFAIAFWSQVAKNGHGNLKNKLMRTKKIYKSITNKKFGSMQCSTGENGKPLEIGFSNMLASKQRSPAFSAHDLIWKYIHGWLGGMFSKILKVLTRTCNQDLLIGPFCKGFNKLQFPERGKIQSM